MSVTRSAAAKAFSIHPSTSLMPAICLFAKSMGWSLV